MFDQKLFDARGTADRLSKTFCYRVAALGILEEENLAKALRNMHSLTSTSEAAFFRSPRDA